MAGGLASVGASLSGQLAGGAVGGVANPWITAINQWANQQFQINLVNYEQGALLHQLGFVHPDSFKEFRTTWGMIGDRTTSQQLQYSLLGDDGIAGFNLQTWNSIHTFNDRALIYGKNVPSIQETLFLLNRGLITERLAQHFLKIGSHGENALAAVWEQARFEIPGPSDLIRFVVRDVFNPEVIAAFGYNKEFPINVLPWAEKQGFGGPTGIVMPAGATTTNGNDNRNMATWFDAYWWAHWELPSPTQAFEMFHRGYSQSRFGPSPFANQDTFFESRNLSLLLKTADYPDYWRKRLEMISYLPLTRVDVRRMYQDEVIQIQDVYHNYRAQGYDDENAWRLTQWTDKQVKRQKIVAEQRTCGTLKIKEIEEMYCLGILGVQETRDRLTELGIKGDSVQRCITTFNLRCNKQKYKEYMSLLKKAYMDGMISNDQLDGAFNQIGVNINRRQYYSELWRFERDVKKKYLSAKAALDIYIEGVVTENDLIVKLRNLNYPNGEIVAMVNSARRKIIANLRQAQSKMEKMREQQLAQIIKSFLAPYTDKNIIAFYNDDLLQDWMVYKILKLRGWRKDAIGRWMKEYLETELTEEAIEKADEETLDEEDFDTDEETTSQDEENSQTKPVSFTETDDEVSESDKGDSTGVQSLLRPR